MARAYQLTAGGVIGKARILINDTVAPYRNSDTELIGWLNDAINVALGLFPGLFAKTGTHTCVAGYLQEIVFNRSARFMEVIGIPEADALTLTQFAPNWMAATAGATENWMNVPGEPLRFNVYPPAVAGVTLPIRYVESPLPLTTISDVVPMPENFEPSLVDFVAGREEMKDDEHVNSNRAVQLIERFSAQIKGVG